MGHGTEHHKEQNHGTGFDRALPVLVMAFFLTLFVCVAAQALADVNPSTPTEHKPVPSILGLEDTLVVGSEQDYPPFATGMTDDTAGGFTVDLWKAVAAQAGLNYTIRVLPFHQLLEGFKEGKINVLINLAISDERRQFADFTVPHVTVHGAIFVRKGETGIRSEEDLAGKSIIVLKADLAHDYAVSKGWGKQLVLVDTSAEGMRLLASGKHDALLLGKLAGMLTLQATKLTNIKALKVKAGFSQKFAFAVPKGQSELLSKLNEGLSSTKSNGRYEVLYGLWFGIYEANEISLRAAMKYIMPLAVIFVCFAGYIFYRVQVKRKDAERKYRDLYDHAPDMFLSIETKSATIIDCNQTLLDVTGYSREEIIGRSMYEIYHQDCASQVGIAFHTFMTSKEVHGVKLQLRRKDGSKIDVSMNASAVCDKNGVALQCRTALRDVSAR
jgi:PAS domain S-box-containing protein